MANKSKKEKLKQLEMRQNMLDAKLNAVVTLLSNRLSIHTWIQEIITKGRTESGKKKAMAAYNAFTGDKNISEVEQASKMDHSTLIQAIEQWEEEGLIYLHHKEGRSKFYKHIVPLR
ncbi:MAG: hypothetical protein GWO20_00555 [Candidatus Korarchaeota archaeon]|nr:hypothetical protein [Candidatus Korarchaeota archaeon]NIU82071.1 hypothetical protein [Candidatus Thorarchaeota archaeon]NIW12491.1 hypothetical protein [Candidatus Thorarchaeota archaeon]NIW50705.1 hypothetical protein [Candidatus Korarchaeota archaeon]